MTERNLCVNCLLPIRMVTGRWIHIGTDDSGCRWMTATPVTAAATPTHNHVGARHLNDILAEKFHDLYERLAPAFGYGTRAETAVPWSEVPDNNRALMRAVMVEMRRRGYLRVPYPPEMPPRNRLAAAALRSGHNCTCSGGGYVGSGHEPHEPGCGQGDGNAISPAEEAVEEMCWCGAVRALVDENESLAHRRTAMPNAPFGERR